MDFGINEQFPSDEERVSEDERVRGPHPYVGFVSANAECPFKSSTLL